MCQENPSGHVTNYSLSTNVAAVLLTHGTGGEGAVLWRPLLVSEARRRSVVGRKSGVVVMMVGLMGRRRGVAVVVVWRVVGRRLVHAGVGRLTTSTTQMLLIWEEAQPSNWTRRRATCQSLPGRRRANVVVIIPHVVVIRLTEKHRSVTLPVKREDKAAVPDHVPAPALTR